MRTHGDQMMNNWHPSTADLRARTGHEDRSDYLEEGARASGHEKAWWILAGASLAAAVLGHALMAFFARVPVFPFDEITLLEFSALFAGIPGEGDLRGAGYYPGWSVLMAPLWWITSDPEIMYRGAIWLGALIGVLTIWPLSRIAVRFGLTRPQSLVAAAVVMTLPVRTVQAGNTMSEKPLFLAMALVLLFAVRAWEKPTALRASLVGGAAVIAMLMHARAQVVVIAVVVWLLCLALRNWRAAAVSVPVTVGLAWALNQWALRINDRMLAGPFNQGEGVFEKASEQALPVIGRSLFGQMWTQTVGTGGLFVVGAAVVLAMVWGEIRRLGIGPMCLLAAMSAGFIIVSVASWANEHSMYLAGWRRLDGWLYGRYMDPVTSLVTLVGACAILRSLSLMTRVIAVVGAMGLFCVTLLRVAPAAPTWAFVTPAHLPGLMPWHALLPDERWPSEQWIFPSLTNEQQFWLWATLPAALILLLTVLLRWRSERVRLAVVSGLVVLAAAGTVASVPANIAFQKSQGSQAAIAGEVREIADTQDVQLVFDGSCRAPGANTAVVQMRLAFWSEPVAMQPVTDRSEITGDRTLAYSCTNDPSHLGDGAMRVGSGEYSGYSLWVLPGSLQDELAHQGRLAS